MGNRYYQFVPDLSEFKERCKSRDAEGFDFLFLDEDNEGSKIPKVTDSEDADSEDLDLGEVEKREKTIENQKEINESLDDIEEEEYEKKDGVKKWQFGYNQSTCFFHNYPEINSKKIIPRT